MKYLLLYFPLQYHSVQDILNEKDREKLKNDTLKGIQIDMETDLNQYNLALDILKYRLIQADSLIMDIMRTIELTREKLRVFQGQKISKFSCKYWGY